MYPALSKVGCPLGGLARINQEQILKWAYRGSTVAYPTAELSISGTN